MACKSCGEKRRGAGADGPTPRVREIATGETVTVEIGAALPLNVLLPMRLLALWPGRRLLIHLPTMALPLPIAQWLVERFPGQVVIADRETGDTETTTPVASPASKGVGKQKKASKRNE